MGTPADPTYCEVPVRFAYNVSVLLKAAVVAAAIASFGPRVATAAGPGEAAAAVPEEQFKRGVMSCLGDSFEFLGGEVGRTKGRVGGWSAERFWFAKVRALKAGEFAVSYTLRFDFPEDAKRNVQLPERAAYVIPIKVGERGARRVVMLGYPGSVLPHADVGDTLLIPIHVDRFRTGHAFVVPDMKRLESRFAIIKTPSGIPDTQPADAKPAARNDAPELLKMMASRAGSARGHSATVIYHSVNAVLEFMRPGEFNLVGNLAMTEEKGAADEMAIRVLPKDKPVTVVLEYMDYAEYSGKPLFGGSSEIRSGTLEVRVGDHVFINCGQYATSAATPAGPVRLGVVTARAFKPIEPYEVEARK
jgi:hypothetical protein